MTWWHRQRIAVTALVVAAVAMVGATVWLDVLPSIRPTDRVIEAESTVDLAGQTLTLGPAEWDEFDAPDGARTLSVRLSSRGDFDAKTCGNASLTETSTERTWLSTRAPLDVPYDEGENSCIAESSSYRILLVFLLPDDVEGPFVLDIEGSDQDLARFRIEP